MAMSPHPWSRRAFLKSTLGAAALGLPCPSAAASPRPTLSLQPFLARPTTRSILVSARNGLVDSVAHLEVRPAGEEEWTRSGDTLRAGAGDFLDWSLDGLQAATPYEYRLVAAVPGGEPGPIARGRFTTQRTGEDAFDAALMTDAHTGTFVDGEGPIEVLDEVVRNVRREAPELVLALGDNVAWRTSRNEPQSGPSGATRAYDMYRRHMGPLTRSCPHFGLIGNWEGESGKLPDESVELVSEVRRRFTPNPDHRTYPQGGSPDEDYYAFAWGPALFVALNVQSYTRPSGAQPTPRDDVTVVEDWTLGPEQLAWMERTLEASDHPYVFVCIHHAVGGDAANERETLYGRGGPRAADVGEQKIVHEAMREFGVQAFFFGHDHVFVHERVDEIHYALPGSCGAPWKFGRDITGYARSWADSGHARLSVRPDRATVSFVNLAGQVIHEFSVRPR